jgi:hypothetical protein
VLAIVLLLVALASIILAGCAQVTITVIQQTADLKAGVPWRFKADSPPILTLAKVDLPGKRARLDVSNTVEVLRLPHWE